METGHERGNVQALPWHGLSLPGPSVIALGLFDGVHRGHQEILRRTRETGRDQNLLTAVFTFSNHPRMVLNHQSTHPPRFLIPVDRRIELFKEAGISQVLIPEFTHGWSDTPPEVFAKAFLSMKLGVRSVVVGFNYCFGRRASGTASDLVDFGKRFGFTTEVVPPFLCDGEEVSSTRIRNDIQNGRIAEANRLLGRPYEISGKVIQGDQRGRTLGFPTANIEPELPPLLPLGVYAVEVYEKGFQGNTPLGPGMFFIGPRRTFYGEEPNPTLEVHLLHFNGDLYGKLLRVGILGWIRPPKRFSGADELIRQIERDQIACQKFFDEHQLS
jgi:riboflavin kinase / FMN adenylyltransferase